VTIPCRGGFQRRGAASGKAEWGENKDYILFILFYYMFIFTGSFKRFSIQLRNTKFCGILN
jgi:hypothetical protein